MGSTTLELVEFGVTKFGFVDDGNIVAMGIDYSTLKHYCKQTFGVEPLVDGDRIERGTEKVYSIRLSKIPIIR